MTALTPAPVLSAQAAGTDRDDADPRRARLLEAAAGLLAEEGPHGLSLRRIAALAGGSTQLVYTLFGGKAGLADELYAEGFRRLGLAMTAAVDASGASPGDPERVRALGRGYRAFALAEPAFFLLMFGRAIPGFTPAVRTRLDGRECTLGQVVTAVQECFDAGTLVGDDAEALARRCWASTHGFVALEVAGLLPPDAVEDLIDASGRAQLDSARPAARAG